MFSAQINGFQFLYGSIKAYYDPTDVSSSDEFQFLYGSIKAQSFNKNPGHHQKFQFLYGSIKALYVLGILPVRLYFNSSMVRLKHVFVRSRPFLFRNFNSSMVRLKL